MVELTELRRGNLHTAADRESKPIMYGESSENDPGCDEDLVASDERAVCVDVDTDDST